MKFETSKALRVCEICGDHRGRTGPDHSECSKLKQEIHQDDKRKARQKRLTRKQTDYMGIQANKDYD